MTDRYVNRLETSAFPDAPLHFAALTDVGEVREQNEDACGVLTKAETPLPVEAVFIAADGVGGHVGGAVASRFVVDAVRDTFASQDAIDSLRPWMETLLQSIHRELLREAKGRGMSAAMGSTATVGVVDGDRLVLAHVGDSRAYRLRDGRLEQLTEDDSWVAEQARAGLLTKEEMATNPQKNVLTQCLGIGESLRVHVTEEQLQVGDRYLLCSDGLHGEVDDPGIRDVLAIEADPAVAAERLIELANSSGGPDNITAVVFDVGTVPGTRHRDPTPTLGEEDATPVIVPGVDPEQRQTVAPLIGRPGASWLITAGLAVLVTAGAAGSWATLRQPASAANIVPLNEARATESLAPEATATPNAATPTPSLPASPTTAPVTPTVQVTPDSAQPDTARADSVGQDSTPTPQPEPRPVDVNTPSVPADSAAVADTLQTASPIRPDTSSGPSLQE